MWLIIHIIHPCKLTWHITVGVWKMGFLCKWMIFRFHVNFPGCTSSSYMLQPRLHLRSHSCRRCHHCRMSWKEAERPKWRVELHPKVRVVSKAYINTILAIINGVIIILLIIVIINTLGPQMGSLVLNGKGPSLEGSNPKMDISAMCWFQMFFIVIPIWWNDPMD